jgi:hypothetical protein
VFSLKKLTGKIISVGKAILDLTRLCGPGSRWFLYNHPRRFQFCFELDLITRSIVFSVDDSLTDSCGISVHNNMYPLNKSC